MINIYNQDCIEAMKQMKDDAYDLAIVDPPYGIGFDREHNAMTGIRKDGTIRKSKKWNNPKLKNYTAKDWDKERPSAEYFQELQRVSKKQIIWGGNYFADLLPPSGGWVVWDKLRPQNFTLSQGELAWVSFTGSLKIIKLLWIGFCKCEKVDRIHPTQKPVSLYKELLRLYAKEGDKILDTHGGSCSLAIACSDLAYDADIFEIDKEYFDLATKRLKEHQRQLRLFYV